MIEYHNELIKCPECKAIQWAKVEHTLPWFTRIHTCASCKYLIMESEWDKQIPKVLTMWQPWASLFVHKIKELETRPKPTSWTINKGSYLIHAAGKWSKIQRDICLQEPFKSALISLGLIQEFINENTSKKVLIPMFYENINLGAIIGAVDITECHKIELTPVKEREPSLFKLECPNVGIWTRIREPELSFGDYREDRYVWVGKNHRVLKDPIPYKNGQGYYLDFKGDESKIIF